MGTRIISIRVSEQCVDVADALAREHGMSRSKLVEFLIERAVAENERWNDREHLKHMADHRAFSWRDRSE